MVFNTTHSWKWNGIITIQNEKQQEGDISVFHSEDYLVISANSQVKRSYYHKKWNGLVEKPFRKHWLNKSNHSIILRPLYNRYP